MKDVTVNEVEITGLEPASKFLFAGNSKRRPFDNSGPQGKPFFPFQLLPVNVEIGGNEN